MRQAISRDCVMLYLALSLWMGNASEGTLNYGIDISIVLAECPERSAPNKEKG